MPYSESCLRSRLAGYIFARVGGAWQQQGAALHSSSTSVDNFGQAVALSGHTAVFGAVGSNAAYVYSNGPCATDTDCRAPAIAPKACVTLVAKRIPTAQLARIAQRANDASPRRIQAAVEQEELKTGAQELKAGAQEPQEPKTGAQEPQEPKTPEPAARGRRTAAQMRGMQATGMRVVTMAVVRAPAELPTNLTGTRVEPTRGTQAFRVMRLVPTGSLRQVSAALHATRTA